MRYTNLLPLIAAGCLGTASASVSFLVDAEVLADAGGTPISVTSAILLVIDTAGDGFGDVIPGNANVGDFLNGVDDLVVYADTAGDTSGEPGLLFGASPAIPVGVGLTEPTIGEGVSLYWFPDVPIGGAIAAGASYGRYTELLPKDGSQSWVVPPDGTSNHTLAFITTDSANIGGGSNAPEAGFASLRVIPEPSTASLALLAGLGLLGRRRR